MARIRIFTLYGNSHWIRIFETRTARKGPIQLKSLSVDASRRALHNRLFGRPPTMKTDGARVKKRFVDFTTVKRSNVHN